ncbi:MAG: hypothetical protein M0Z50_09615 [Planctomycetia bacterium]|nr:hypothetical protein [Planctomycetia bacterium]
MKNNANSIWFLIGILLFIYGALIAAAGIYGWFVPPRRPGIELWQLHAGIWWGALLLAMGLFYILRFRIK